MPFDEQTVSVVMGANSWLGRAIEQALSERPGKVVAGYGSRLDIADEWAVGSFFETLGTIDHVIVTGGPAPGERRSTLLDFAAARAAFDVEFWGVLAVVKEAALHLRPGGSITLTSDFPMSCSAIAGPAINAALGMAAKVLARELAPLRVNFVEAGIHCTEAGMGPPTSDCPSYLAHGYLFAIDHPWITGAVLPLRRRGQRLQLQTHDPQKTLGVTSPEVTSWTVQS